MKKRILSMILTLSMVITLLPVGTLSASAAEEVYDGNYTYTYTYTGSRDTLLIGYPGVYLLDNVNITANSIEDPGIKIQSNDVTLVIKGNVTVRGADGWTIRGGAAGILVPQGYSIKIVGYQGTTNTLNCRGGNGGNAANGANGISAGDDDPGAGGEGGDGGSGGGAAIGTNGGVGYTYENAYIYPSPCGTVNVDSSNLQLNLIGGSSGSAGYGGNGGSSDGWSVFGAAAQSGGGGGGGGGAGYSGKPIGTGGQGGFKGGYGGSGVTDGSHPNYAGGGGGGAGGNGSIRGGGGGGGARVCTYAGWSTVYTEQGGRGGSPG